MTRISQLAEDQLRDAVRKVEIMWQDRNRGEDPSRPFVMSTSFVAKTGGSAIPAQSGDTPGSGTVTLKHLNPDTGDWETITRPDGSDADVTVYNFTNDASGTNTYIGVDLVSDSKGNGIYILKAEGC